MIDRQILWRQFGAAIDMLENAMNACPDELWSDPSRKPEWTDDDVVGFWYLAFHALFWTDFYLSATEADFKPPPPFTLDELDPAGLLPARPYTKEELQAYVLHCRRKCQSTIAGLTEGQASHVCRFRWVELSFEELMLYNMRHVQHHAAQMNLILRRGIHSAPGWVTRAESG